MLQSEFISGVVWLRYRKVREMVNGAGALLVSNFPRLDEREKPQKFAGYKPGYIRTQKREQGVFFPMPSASRK